MTRETVNETSELHATDDSEEGTPGSPVPLWDRLELQPGRPDHIHVWSGEYYVTWSSSDWLEKSVRFASGIRSLGVGRGERVGCLLTTAPESIPAVLGVWFAGACLVSLPVIPRGMDPNVYLTMLAGITSDAELAMVLCDAVYVETLRDAGLGVRVVAYGDIDGRGCEPNPPGPAETAFIQYSSGSTSEPCGCMLTGDAIVAQLTVLAAALAIDPERDTGVVWLPLSHDMGLFGCLLLSYWTGFSCVFSTPQRFLGYPLSWLEDCARFQATISATPNFALDLVTRIASVRMPQPFPMRRLVIGGERVEPGTLERTTSVLGDERVPRSALVPAYGLAEAVLAVTMTPVGRGPRVLSVDRQALAAGNVEVAHWSTDGDAAKSVSFVSAGIQLDGTHVYIDGQGDVGEIVLRSRSLAQGYLGAPDATQARFTPDGLRTGDLGFLSDGELFVTGRLDDLMCIGGRNLYARDLELAVARVAGVRPGNCAVVDVDTIDGTQLVAIIEPDLKHPDFSVMEEQIVAVARESAGARIMRCLFLPRGRLPKSPSGKIQRYRCREMAATTRTRDARFLA
jgi:fatty-acyl-CoA synthase